MRTWTLVWTVLILTALAPAGRAGERGVELPELTGQYLPAIRQSTKRADLGSLPERENATSVELILEGVGTSRSPANPPSPEPLATRFVVNLAWWDEETQRWENQEVGSFGEFSGAFAIRGDLASRRRFERDPTLGEILREEQLKISVSLATELLPGARAPDGRHKARVEFYPEGEITAAKLVFRSEPSGESSNSDASPGRFLFHCNSANYAWGFHFSGAFIDERGDVYEYTRNNPQELPKGYTHRGKGAISARDLEALFHGAKRTRTVDRRELEGFAAEVADAAGGKIESKHVAYDAGGCGCEALQFRAEDESYDVVHLGESGSFERHNTRRAARRIHEWLLREIAPGCRPL